MKSTNKNDGKREAAARKRVHFHHMRTLCARKIKEARRTGHQHALRAWRREADQWQ